MKDVKVIMLGTGCPRPEINRSGPAQVLLIDDMPILIDCGEGTTQQLMKAGIPPESVKHLFMTHLHSDHLLGYGQFLLGVWELGRRELTVVGPKGMKKYHETLLSMFDEDIDYRLSLGRPINGLLDVNIIEIDSPSEVIVDIPAKVTTERMIHNVMTFAFRFEIDEKVVVVSGDTAPNPKLADFAKDADILIHDCCIIPNDVYHDDTQNPEWMQLWNRIKEEHSTPVQAAETANKANAKKLVLTHFLPNADIKKAYELASEVFKGTVIAPDDLQTITVDHLSKVSG